LVTVFDCSPETASWVTSPYNSFEMDLNGLQVHGNMTNNKRALTTYPHICLNTYAWTCLVMWLRHMPGHICLDMFGYVVKTCAWTHMPEHVKGNVCHLANAI
jgi:hypothetical protein